MFTHICITLYCQSFQYFTNTHPMSPVGAFVVLPEASAAIHPNGSAAAVVPSEESINLITLRIWLLAVDKHIDSISPDSSLEIMKLGLLGDKDKVPYEALNRAKQPSEIFTALAHVYYTVPLPIQYTHLLS